jgi:ferredoxin-NADP reductase
MTLQLAFAERIVRTPAAVSYRFSRPDGFSFQAGQYMLLWLDAGGSLMRPLSLSDGPQQEFIEFTKRMTGSAYCQALEALRPGDLVAAKGPLGSFSAGSVEQLVCIAGGIGITPVRSILAEMFSERSAQPVTRRVTLLYGNADENDIAFAAELDEWEARNRRNFRLIHVVQRPGGRLKAYPGFVTADIIRREVPDLAAPAFLVSGPPVMVKAVESQLASLGVNPEQIRTDRFLGYS